CPCRRGALPYLGAPFRHAVGSWKPADRGRPPPPSTYAAPIRGIPTDATGHERAQRARPRTEPGLPRARGVQRRAGARPRLPPQGGARRGAARPARPLGALGVPVAQHRAAEGVRPSPLPPDHADAAERAPPRRPPLPVLRQPRAPHPRPRPPQEPGWPRRVGQPRGRLRAVQQPEGEPDARGGADGAPAAPLPPLARDVPPRLPRRARRRLEAVPLRRLTAPVLRGAYGVNRSAVSIRPGPRALRSTTHVALPWPFRPTPSPG